MVYACSSKDANFQPTMYSRFQARRMPLGELPCSVLMCDMIWPCFYHDILLVAPFCPRLSSVSQSKLSQKLIFPSTCVSYPSTG